MRAVDQLTANTDVVVTIGKYDVYRSSLCRLLKDQIYDSEVWLVDQVIDAYSAGLSQRAKANEELFSIYSIPKFFCQA